MDIDVVDIDMVVKGGRSSDSAASQATSAGSMPDAHPEFAPEDVPSTVWRAIEWLEMEATRTRLSSMLATRLQEHVPMLRLDRLAEVRAEVRQRAAAEGRAMTHAQAEEQVALEMNRHTPWSGALAGVTL